MQEAAGNVKIGDFVFERAMGVVHNGDQRTKLEPLSQAFLCLLLDNKEHVVTREQLLSHVWNNRHVTDDSIRRVVKKLRDAFSDDARQPKYIKTVSMQGYQLIAQVTDEAVGKSTTDSVTVDKHSRAIQYALAVALMGLILLSAGHFISSHQQPSETEASSKYPLVSKLTQQGGAEINGDYSAVNDHLIYLNKVNKNEGYHIYSRRLATGEVKRLTFDDANYQRAYWSPDGDQLVFQKGTDDQATLWLADYDSQRGLVNSRQIMQHQSPGTLLGWSRSNDAVYVSSRVSDTVIQAIYRYSLADGNTEQITFPGLRGYGDYTARESHDGRQLAILRNGSERHYMLMILDLESQDLVAQKALKFFASSIIWHPENHTLALSSFKGDFYYYDLETDQLSEQAGSQPGLNDAFHYCGTGCYFMRQHHMDYTDIAEVPSPFAGETQQALLYLASPKAEFNAIYNHRGDTVYFTQKDEYQGRLCRRTASQRCQSLLTFNPRHILNNLSLNPSESQLAGKLENRIFVLDLATFTLQYITSAIDSVSVPTWKNDTTLLFSRQEQNQFVQMQYSVSRDKLIKGTGGVFLERSLPDGRIFWASAEGDIYQKTHKGIDKLVAQMPFPQYVNWSVLGDALYYTHSQANGVAMTRISLVDGSQKTRVIAPNASTLNFSLHPSGQKILMTKELLSNSDLVKVQWH